MKKLKYLLFDGDADYCVYDSLEEAQEECNASGNVGDVLIVEDDYEEDYLVPQEEEEEEEECSDWVEVELGGLTIKVPQGTTQQELEEAIVAAGVSGY